MTIEVLKSKIHRVKITRDELHYVGSIRLGEDLMAEANIMENEKVHTPILVFPNSNNQLIA